MPRIMAWQCSLTGDVFAEKKDYQTHLRKLGKTAQIRKQHVEDVKHLDTLVYEFSRLSSFDAILQMLKDNGAMICRAAAVANHLSFNQGREPSALIGEFDIDYITLHGMKWNDQIRNCHYAPRDQPTNFRRVDLPLSHPGWQGKIHVRRRDTGSVFDITDTLRKFGVHSGTGGGGYYDVTIFAADFPSLFAWEKMNDRIPVASS